MNRRTMIKLLSDTKQELNHVFYLLGATKGNTPAMGDIAHAKEDIVDLRQTIAMAEATLRAQRD